MLDLVKEWKGLNEKQAQINKSGAEPRKKDTVNLIVNMAKIDLESKMSAAELARR